MLIQKFGGTSLADIEGFIAAAGIISNAAAKEKVVVVLSAMAGVTDLLENSIETAINNGDFNAVIQGIKDREQGVLQKMAAEGWDCPLATDFLQVQLKRLESRLAGVALLEQCPEEVKAELLSSGEGFSSRLMCDLLQAQGYAARWSDTGVLPPANDSYTDSLVDVEAAAPLLIKEP